MSKDHYTGVLKSEDNGQSESLSHTLSKPIVLECGTCNGYTFSTDSSILFMTNPRQTCTPKTLGIVNIDTRHLCRPKIKVDFSCNAHFVQTACTGSVQIEFQLFKICNYNKGFPVGTWYFKIQGQDNSMAETFSFIYCDCNSNPESYQYCVRCQPIDIDSATISITNCHLAALAQST